MFLEQPFADGAAESYDRFLVEIGSSSFTRVLDVAGILDTSYAKFCRHIW
jgi:hypothetical protein